MNERLQSDQESREDQVDALSRRGSPHPPPGVLGPLGEVIREKIDKAPLAEPRENEY